MSAFLAGMLDRLKAFLNRLLLLAAYSGRRGLKLHLGCGERRLEGYLNLDNRKTPAVDFVLDIARLPFSDASVSRIESYHVIEHLPRNTVPGVLLEWQRVLAPGGELVLELPDFDAAAKEYLAGNSGRLDTIFGLQRFPGDVHYFGYNPERLGDLLRSAGFSSLEVKPARDYHAAHEPCFRLECRK